MLLYHGIAGSAHAPVGPLLLPGLRRYLPRARRLFLIPVLQADPGAALLVRGQRPASLLFLFIWVRGTLPRFRYDQLMRFAWKFLFPVAVVNLLITGLLVALS